MPARCRRYVQAAAITDHRQMRPANVMFTNDDCRDRTERSSLLRKFRSIASVVPRP